MTAKKLILVNLLLLFMLSCTDDISDEIITQAIESSHPSLKTSGDKKFDLLGHGYDIYRGGFYKPDDVKEQVIDVVKLNNLYPNVFKKHETGSSYRRVIIATSSKEYTSNLNSTLNSSFGKLFPLTLNGTFSENIVSNSANSFASYHINIPIQRLTIASATLDQLRGCLTDEFLNNLKSRSSREVINLYGTHVLVDITLGGRLDIFYKTRNTSETTTKKTSVDSGFKKGLLDVFNINVSVDYNETTVKKNYEQILSYSTIGGDYSAKLNATHSLESNMPKVDTDVWVSSCKEDNARFIDANTNILIPLIDMIPKTPEYEMIALGIHTELMMIEMNAMMSN